MKVHLSFDVEIWCNGWDRLDEVFPAQYERYVYGRSAAGEYALPETLSILRRHGLHGVFFVEPLFAARFGRAFLDPIVSMIRADGHEVQLHIHPEWVDEITPAVITNNSVKRQHLCHYDVDEQTEIIAFGKQLLAGAGAGPITTFRAGSYAANRDSFVALARNGIFMDSSMNACFDISGADLRAEERLFRPFSMSGVRSVPVSVFRDGLGRLRPAQVGACSFAEMRDALSSALGLGWREFVIVSHNFELLKPGTSQPDTTVVRRFDRLCRHLAAHRGTFDVCGYGSQHAGGLPPVDDELPAAGLGATALRYVEQAWRRVG